MRDLKYAEELRQKARDLVKKMTLEEKISQMLHGAASIERLGIPSYNWWNEALHGVARSGTATVFPQAIGLAATFDTDLLYKIADVISAEGRAKYHAYQEEGDHDIYKGLTFWSPNINIFRDPRWGRGHETFGEDPCLTSGLGVAFIKGLQGTDRDRLKSAACAKHFAVHSGPEAVRHEFNAECGDYDLWNTYLPAFEAAVHDGGVEGVMGAYNRTNGEPCCGSETLLVDILRKKWGFDGYITSDCWAIKDFHEFHKITATPVESVALAIKTGCDVNCGNMYGYALAAVNEGKLTEKEIEDAVTHLMITRMRLGLLGAGEVKEYVSIPYEVIDCDTHNELNIEAALNSVVLLKNDGTLPLAPDKIKTIGVIGPNAFSRRALEGNYQGTASEYVTVLDGIRAAAGENNARVLYAEGCHLYKDRVSVLALSNDRLAEARSVAKRSDCVILCLGLDADIEGEEGDTGNEFASGDKINLDLPGKQQLLLEETVKAANGKPVIAVLISGSALAVTWADENAGVNGIMQAFYPGAQGGRAIADIIFGKHSPCGKLPVTFYRSTEDLPDFCDYNMDNRTYRYFKGEALYPFGFGLSYARFEMSELSADKNGFSVTVKNVSALKAGEVVQAYASNPALREIRSLIGFKKVTLEAGQSVRISVPFDKNAFSRFNSDGDAETVSGEYTVSVGFCQPDERSTALYKNKPLTASILI